MDTMDERHVRKYLAAAVTTTLLQAGAAVASENSAAVQTGEDARKADKQLPSVVVTGTRASLMSAQKIKRESTGIVDSVVADDRRRRT